MRVNWPLKKALVEKYGTQVEASRALGIRESRLSGILRGYSPPSDKERATLKEALGDRKEVELCL